MSAVASRNDQIPNVDLTAVSWTAHVELPYEQWLRTGSRLGLAGRSAAWWIGDWVHYGTARFGQKYAAAARVTGYDRQTLMNMVYVANRFESSRRRENLSWSHHAELAALEVPSQELWLERAIIERLSVRDLREELVATQARPSSGSRATERSQSTSGTPAPASVSGSRAEALVVCPNCQHQFIP
jgi:hypothetical protein